jgi:hypothetical protein
MGRDETLSSLFRSGGGDEHSLPSQRGGAEGMKHGLPSYK